MPRAFYDPSDVKVKIEYAVNAKTDQLFIPGNNQKYGDNPDSGTMVQRRACNESVIGSTPNDVDPASNVVSSTPKGIEQ